MRFCITLFLFFLVGCNAPKSEPIVFEVETTIEPTADGVLVTKIVISPQDGGYSKMLSEFGEPLKSIELAKGLEAEGLSARVIDAVDVPAIISTIGTQDDSAFVWHGQFVQWRAVIQRRIPDDGILVVASGRSHFVDKGFLSILSRSWLLHRDSELSVYVQLLPTWHIPIEGGLVLAQGEAAKQSTLFRELEIELLLADGEALLLSTELIEHLAANGPQIEGPTPVRLGEGLLGGDVEEGKVILLLIEANILTRE
tara:strand:+ start:2051 stop:2815 length:765 start_codon:yes stop_codon:yes gene_type:complete